MVYGQSNLVHAIAHDDQETTPNLYEEQDIESTQPPRSLQQNGFDSSTVEQKAQLTTRKSLPEETITPQDLTYLPQNTTFLPQDATFIPIETTHIPRGTTYNSFDATYDSQDTIYDSQDTIYDAQDTIYDSQHLYDSQETTFFTEDPTFVTEDTTFVTEDTTFVTQEIKFDIEDTSLISQISTVLPQETETETDATFLLQSETTTLFGEPLRLEDDLEFSTIATIAEISSTSEGLLKMSKQLLKQLTMVTLGDSKLEQLPALLEQIFLQLGRNISSVR